MGDTLQLMEEMMALVILSAIGLNYAIAKVMGLFSSGGELIADAPIPSTIIGSVIGIAILWFGNLSLAGLVVGGIATIISNLLITKYIYPIIEEKVNAIDDKMQKKARDAEDKKRD